MHETGSGARALQDLTGGIVQSFALGSQDRYLTYQVLNSAVPRSTLIVASILPVSFFDNFCIKYDNSTGQIRFSCYLSILLVSRKILSRLCSIK